MVQTIGSAGESLAAGAIFTLPAVFMWAAEGETSEPGFISIADRRVKNTLKQIQKSEINRSSLFSTIEHLEDIEKSIAKIGASYETIIETAEIFKALQEKPKKTSSHPELNALLG